MNKLEKVFRTKYPMLAMLHLKGDSKEEVLERAKKEIDIYYKNGVTAVIVENYYGDYYDMERVLQYLNSNYADKIYGVNCLNMDVMGFELANNYNAKFVQLDSVVGHVKPRDEKSMEAFLNLYREKSDVLLIGGVRFKYQPCLSENTLEEDLLIAKNRCDVVVVTGNATGEETDLDKIKLFRKNLGDFPLIVGAGVNSKNICEQLQFADGAIVGSYLKDNFEDNGEVDSTHVNEMVELFNQIREEK